MSIQAVAWVLDHSQSRGFARLVMIALANHADRETGECFPSQRSIAREAGISVGAIGPKIEELVRLGEVFVVDPGGPRKSARYQLTFSVQPPLESVPVERSGDERSVQPIDRAQRSGDERSGDERSARAEMSAALSPGVSRTVIEPSEDLEAPNGASTLDELKAALVELFGEPPAHGWSLYNRVATWIRDQGGTPDEIRVKAGFIAGEWGRKAVTVTSLEKHWNRYDARVGQVSEVDVERHQAETRKAEREQRARELDAQQRGLPR